MVTNREPGKNAEVCWGPRSCVVKTKMETVALNLTVQADAVNGESPRVLLETARKLVEALERMAELDEE